MGQIVDFFKRDYSNKDYSKKDNTDNSTIDYSEKIRRHNMLIFYRILAGVAVLAVLAVIVYFQYRDMVYSGYEVTKVYEYKEVGSANYLDYNGNILRYSTDGASAFTIDGNMLWNQTYEMQNPIVSVRGDYVAIGDYKGTTIYVMNSTGKQGEIDTTLPIQNFCVAGNGNVAVLLEEDKITWVKLYNTNGSNIATDRTTMANSGYPVSVSLSDNGSILAVSYLFIDSGNLSSSVAFYNFGEVGQNEIDNLVSGYNYPGKIVSYVQFMNEKTSFAVSDSEMEIYSGSQKPEFVNKVEIEDELKSVFHNENYIGLVYFIGEKDALYRLDVYDTLGELRYTKPFSMDYKDIVFGKNNVVIYNSEECLIYNMEDIEKFNGKFRNSVIELIPTSIPTEFIIVTGNKTEKIRLKR